MYVCGRVDDLACVEGRLGGTICILCLCFSSFLMTAVAACWRYTSKTGRCVYLSSGVSKQVKTSFSCGTTKRCFVKIDEVDTRTSIISPGNVNAIVGQ
uniref:Uncharacterized protein n=1 Tax=Peronospora matthiolae TaxID=2874970 RepID=A0AAV1VE90_9STRA